ncbi:PREDICTED: cell wall / vacuolar inhibitor of fructosidase 2-like [Nelumbo nucifera]|uniref:Cell wall / vacuolar inhibitor of fructosidase 2-like n=1 Tax=Nelumbo nucifera TaxID=4432 RepID=A0A1U7YVD9_NELNU|nr:PREDICTED: cell wall / vacuolar inhibitor of fructosidase 2-like [Nelumbo nucifera]
MVARRVVGLLVVYSLAAAAVCFAFGRADEENGNEAESLIQTTCNQLDYRDYCISLLESDPHSELKSDLNGFARIIMEVGLSNATNDYDYIGELVKNTTDNATLSFLHTCSSLYEKTIAGYNSSFNMLSDIKGNYVQLYQTLDSSIQNAQDCEDAFAPQPNTDESPLTERNQVSGMIATIVTRRMIPWLQNDSDG